MMKNKGALSDEEVLQSLDMNEQALEKEALMILDASDEEFNVMSVQDRDTIERIAQRMMTPDEIVKYGSSLYLTQPEN